MDTLSQALWGYGLFGHRMHARLALLFGALPDLCSFGAYLLVRLLDGSFQPGPPPLISRPTWLFISYDIWHSFVVCLPIIALVAYWRRDIAFTMLAWPFHIVLDFPFHSLSYIPTAIFWPISDFTIDGIPWSNPEVWLPNVAGLIVLLAYRYRHKKRGRRP
ncbi:MAG: hypothetical protein LAC66_03440 [Methylotenera sp.]|nr:hypothetical protein [Methylotenera sp.]